LTSHRIRKNSQKIEKTLSRGKQVKRATEEDPSPGCTGEQMSCDQKEA